MTTRYPGQQSCNWWLLRPVSIQELACLTSHNCTLQIHFVQCSWNTGKCNAKQSTQLCHPAWTNAMASLPGPPNTPDFCHEMSPSSKSNMLRHLPRLRCQNPELLVLTTYPYLYYNSLNISRHLFSVSYSSWAIDGFSGLVVSMLASGTQVCGFKPGRSRWIFQT